MLTIVFDRSSFHGDRFERIATSPIFDLIDQRKAAVLHSPIFLEETLAAFKSLERAEWQRQLRFIVEACAGIYLEKQDIWHNELMTGAGPFARHLLPLKPSRRYDSMPRFLKRLQDIADTGEFEGVWNDAQFERNSARTKKKNQREIFRGMRDAVSTGIRGQRIAGSLKEYPYDRFRRTEFVRTAKGLMQLVSPDRHSQLFHLWALNPRRYPYFSAFVDGFLYSGYYAAVLHNQALDQNAQNDYELLTCLNHADLVVSNDEGFFRQAFDTLWLPMGKRLETAESFSKLVARLA